jgi:hypothetical protein
MCLYQLDRFIESDVTLISERSIEIDMEEIDLSYCKVLSRNLPGGTEKTTRNP